MFDEKYKDEIINYYRQSDWGYKYIWYQGKSWGLHHGLDDDRTRTHDDALMNQYRLIIKEGQIKKGMRVLDAGCGVGGGAIHIAKMTGVKTWGITLVPEQVASAQKNAVTLQVEHLTTFKVMDYTKTDFPDNYFDVVFGIESIGYAHPLSDFLNEACRITRPGGRLIIVDGYLLHKPKNEVERRWLDDSRQGWHLKTGSTLKGMTDDLRASGWLIEKVINKTDAIQLSLKRMRLFAWLGTVLPITQGFRDNARALRGWVPGVRNGLFGYYVYVAKKPK